MCPERSVTSVSGRSYKSCDINQCFLADELDSLSSPAATQGMPVELFAGFTRFCYAGTSTKNSTHARPAYQAEEEKPGSGISPLPTSLPSEVCLQPLNQYE